MTTDPTPHPTTDPTTDPGADPAPGQTAVHEVGPEAAGTVLELVHESFGARPPIDPPAAALEETLESVTVALRRHGGLLATVDGQPAASLIFGGDDEMLDLRRVAVRPAFQGMGVAGALVATAEAHAWATGRGGVRLTARAELPATVSFWLHLGYCELGREATTISMGKELPVDLVAGTAEEMRELGGRLARALRAGDLVVLSGALGSGKTTLTQGIGEGLGVRGDITSPTFVIARTHPSLVGGPPLVHADAYRLHDPAEVEDLDLDASVDSSVTVVEWGEEKVEGLADSRLEVTITRRGGGAVPADGGDGELDSRHVRVTPVGPRWVGSRIRGHLTH